MTKKFEAARRRLQPAVPPTAPEHEALINRRTGLPLLDLTGQTFGAWTVIARDDVLYNGVVRWLCRCRCGRERLVQTGSLRNGRSKSCGCIPKAARAEAQAKAKASKTPAVPSLLPLGKPVVNLNGTAQSELITQLVAVHHAANQLLEAMKQAHPHGRDYPAGGFEAAREAWVQRMRQVEALETQCYDMAYAISEQGRQ